MEVPGSWQAYYFSDYFSSGLCDTGRWDEDGQIWYIEPASRVAEDRVRNFLIIGRPGVDGIEWGNRRGQRGIWAYYPIDDEYRLLAESARALREGYESGTIHV